MTEWPEGSCAELGGQAGELEAWEAVAGVAIVVQLPLLGLLTLVAPTAFVGGIIGSVVGASLMHRLSARTLGITSSLCGQAPSSHPEFIEQLIGMGITSLSMASAAVLNRRYCSRAVLA